MSQWIKATLASDLTLGQKGCLKLKDQHIALIHYEEKKWYAVQNVCPHDQQSVLSRGILGDQKGEAKIVCPLHKHAFALDSGKHLGGDSSLNLQTFPVKKEGDYLFVQL